MNRSALIALVAIVAVGTAAIFHWRIPHHPDATTASDPAQMVRRIPEAADPQSASTAPEPATAQGTGMASAAIREDLPGDPVERDGPDALAAYRQSLEQQYEGLGKALALTPDEVIRIIDMQVRFRADTQSAGPGESARENYLRILAQQSELQATLGSKYTKLEEYTLYPIVRKKVDDLQTLLEISDIKPLTSAQLTSLATALTTEEVRASNDISSVARIPGGGNEVARLQDALEWKQRHDPDMNRRLVLTASRQLDAQQLSAYIKMLDDTYNREVASLRSILAQRQAADRR